MINKKNLVHVACANFHNAVLLTSREFYPKVQHYGILIAYRYDNPKRDMTVVRIVKALKNIRTKIESNKLDLRNKVLILNLFG